MTIATALKLQPSRRKVLAHLEEYGNISPRDALITYGIARLAPCIFDLREAGYNIVTEMRKDAADHPYARYFLETAH